MLFGPDGVGGQPGAAGKALDFATGADVKSAPANENGQQILERYGKDLARLPFTLAKLPLDFISEPSMFTNGRQIDIGAILSPTYRKEKKDQIATEQAAEKARNIYQGVKMADEFARTMTERQPDQRYAMVQQFEAAGGSPDQSNAALGQANAADQQAQIARQGVASALPGLPPELVAATDFTPNQAVSTIVAAKNAEEDARRQAASEGRAVATFNAQDRRPFAVRAAEKAAAKKAAAEAAAQVKAAADAHALAVAQAKAEADAQTKKVGRIFGRKTKALEKGDFAGAGVTDVNPKNSDYIPNFLQSGTEPIPSKSIAQLEEDRVAAEKAARDAAYAGIDQALPLDRLKNIPARKEAKAAVDGALDAAAEAAKAAPPSQSQALTPQSTPADVRDFIANMKTAGASEDDIGRVLRQRGVPRETVAEAIK